MKTQVTRRGRGFKWTVIDSGAVVLHGRSRLYEVAVRRAEQAAHLWENGCWIDIGVTRSICSFGGGVVAHVNWKHNNYIVMARENNIVATGKASKKLCLRAVRRCAKRGTI